MGEILRPFLTGRLIFLLLPGVALGIALKAITGFAGGAVVGYGLLYLSAEMVCLVLPAWSAQGRHRMDVLVAFARGPGLVLLARSE